LELAKGINRIRDGISLDPIAHLSRTANAPGTCPQASHWSRSPMQATETASYLHECRDLVIQGIRDLVPADTPYGPALYDLVLDYPTRQAKALRPALCIATCRAHGGLLAQVLPTATVLELYHSAFLVHDDIEDDSEQRRGGRPLFEALTLGILEESGTTLLPTRLIDALARATDLDHLEPLLAQLFGLGGDDDP
jgi:hypothetical protein